jgi:hypothetical protein
MSSIKDKVGDAAHAVADAASRAADFVKEKAGMGGGDGIRPHMAVISSCGCTVGKVDHVEGSAIKLTRNDSPDGQHHFIPRSWVARVDEHVHLSKNATETKQGWKADAASCGCA